MDREMLLPKLWLEAVQSMWEKRIPTDYPNTTSIFALNYGSDEVTAKVREMESTIGSENSIITSEMVPEHTVIGAYYGTYNVDGDPGELVLISPQKIADNVVDVIAMHLNEETSEWNKIEDAQIIDGYVYGTLESFSPIAVFGIKRSSFIESEFKPYGNSTVFVCNGVPTLITTNEKGEVIAKDGNNVETIIPEDCKVIIGGTIDGSIVKSTNVSIINVNNKNLSVIGGSYSSDSPINIDSITISAEDCSLKTVSGSWFNNRTEKVNITVKDCTLKSGIGIGESYISALKKDSNTSKNMKLASNAWIKEGKLKIENSTIYVLYAGTNSGYHYIDKTKAEIVNTKATYLVVGNSNGHCGSAKAKVENCTVDCLTMANRGSIVDSSISVKNSSIKDFFVAADLEKEDNGTVEEIRIDIGADVTTNLVAGQYDGKKIDSIKASEIVKSLKISRSANITYSDEDYNILGDLIKIK